MRPPDGQSRLPHPGRAGQGCDREHGRRAGPRVGQQRVQVGQLAGAAGECGHRRWQLRRVGGRCAGPPGATRRKQPGVLSQDLLVDLDERRRGIHSGTVDQGLAGAAEGGERVRLPPGAVQRPHQLAPQHLVPRVPAGQPFQLRDQLRAHPGGEIRLDPVRRGGQPKLLEPDRLSTQRRNIRELAVRLAAPQPQRRSQRLRGDRGLTRLQRPPTVRGQPLEPHRVDHLQGPPGNRYPGARVTISSPTVPPATGESTWRSRDTYARTVRSASGGRCCPQSPSTRARRLTTRPAWITSSASSAVSRGPPSSSTRPPASISSGPSTRNCTPVAVTAGIGSAWMTHAVRIAQIVAPAAKFASIQSAEPEMSQRVVERFMERTTVGHGGSRSRSPARGSARLGRWSRPVSPASGGGCAGSNRPGAPIAT